MSKAKELVDIGGLYGRAGAEITFEAVELSYSHLGHNDMSFNCFGKVCFITATLPLFIGSMRQDHLCYYFLHDKRFGVALCDFDSLCSGPCGRLILKRLEARLF